MNYSKHNYLIKIIIFFLMIPGYLLSDTVFLKDGSKYDGSILNADNFIVNIQINDTTLVQIPHHQIKSIFFTKADVLSLGLQKSVKCKILKREYPYLYYVTPEGVQKIRTINYESYYYNAEDSLKVTALPPTGPEFKNYVMFIPKQKKVEVFDQNFYVSAGLNIHSPPSESWRDNFLNASSIIGIFGNLRIGYQINKSFSCGIGYEFSQYDIDAARVGGDFDGYQNKFKTYFAFTSFEYYPNINIILPFKILTGIDIGLSKHEGKILLYSFRQILFEDESYQFAIRPRIGVITHPVGKFSVNFEFAYIISESDNISIPYEGYDSFSIDFSGLTFITNLKYNFTF